MKYVLLYMVSLLMLFTSCKDNGSETSAPKVVSKDGALDVFVVDAQTPIGFIEAKEGNIVLDYILGDASLSYEPDTTIYRIENQRTAITVLKGEKLKIARTGVGSVRISYHYSK